MHFGSEYPTVEDDPLHKQHIIAANHVRATIVISPCGDQFFKLDSRLAPGA
jgi:hypothetical protein